MKKLLIALKLIIFSLFFVSCKNPAQITKNKISQQQAKQLLIENLGEYDITTGFKFGFFYESIIEKENKKYYNFKVSWLGTTEDSNDNHYSRITNYLVSFDGTEIKEYG